MQAQTELGRELAYDPVHVTRNHVGIQPNDTVFLPRKSVALLSDPYRYSEVLRRELSGGISNEKECMSASLDRSLHESDNEERPSMQKEVTMYLLAIRKRTPIGIALGRIRISV